MKVRELIEKLYMLDHELDVCVFTDSGAMLVEEPQVLSGYYEDPNNVKLVLRHTEGTFVALNNYADFDLDHMTYTHES